ncbi:phage protease [Desulfovibrio sp. JY]|nr:phage protease [Desulfovibrio sp. JY]
MPAGSFAGRSGIGPFQLNDPQSVIDATLAAASGADLPIDYDHQILWSRDNGRPAPAAGWFKEFAVRDDGIWARVEWTPTAEACIAAREYRYLSPVFWFDVDGRVLRIEHAALTNTPELEMQALASRLHNPNGGEMTLEQVIAALAAAYGLKPDTTAEGIVTCAQGEAKSLAAMAKRLGLPETAMAYEADKALADVLAAVEETAKAMGMSDPVKPAQLAACARDVLAKRGQPDASPDPTKWAPVSELQAVASRLAALENSQAKDKAVEAVEAAMKAGKVTPGNKDWALAYASKDLEGFKAFAAVAPSIVKPGQEGPHGQPPAADGQLGEIDLAVCSRLGLDPEAFKKSLKKEGV